MSNYQYGSIDGQMFRISKDGIDVLVVDAYARRTARYYDSSGDLVDEGRYKHFYYPIKVHWERMKEEE